MNHIEAFRHYLEIEERRSPGTVRAYVADVQMLRHWQDDEHQQPCAWEKISSADLRGFLASIRPRPLHVRRPLSLRLEVLAHWS